MAREVARPQRLQAAERETVEAAKALVAAERETVAAAMALVAAVMDRAAEARARVASHTARRDRGEGTTSRSRESTAWSGR